MGGVSSTVAGRKRPFNGLGSDVSDVSLPQMPSTAVGAGPAIGPVFSDALLPRKKSSVVGKSLPAVSRVSARSSSKEIRCTPRFDSGNVASVQCTLNLLRDAKDFFENRFPFESGQQAAATESGTIDPKDLMDTKKSLFHELALAYGEVLIRPIVEAINVLKLTSSGAGRRIFLAENERALKDVLDQAPDGRFAVIYKVPESDYPEDYGYHFTAIEIENTARRKSAVVLDTLTVLSPHRSHFAALYRKGLPEDYRGTLDIVMLGGQADETSCSILSCRNAELLACSDVALSSRLAHVPPRERELLQQEGIRKLTDHEKLQTPVINSKFVPVEYHRYTQLRKVLDGATSGRTLTRSLSRTTSELSNFQQRHLHQFQIAEEDKRKNVKKSLGVHSLKLEYYELAIRYCQELLQARPGGVLNR